MAPISIVLCSRSSACAPNFSCNITSLRKVPAKPALYMPSGVYFLGVSESAMRHENLVAKPGVSNRCLHS